MRVKCHQCGAEIDVPAGAKAVVCNECGQGVDVVAEARTVQTEEQQRTPESSAATESGGRRIRVNCPACGRELTRPASEMPDRCPDCDATLETEEQTRRRKVDATAPTAATAPRPPRVRSEERREQTLGWMREHFGNRYEILEFVDSGGMGAVFKARQKRPSRVVALKIMRGAHLASSKQVRRFEREAQAVAMLQHPAIVPVYDYGEVDGQPYFTMEFVEGQDLRRYAQDNNLSRQQICRLVVRVCDAVHYAHQHGVIHRDLKPGNVLIDELERPRLLDFGLSRITGQEGGEMSMLTRTGEFLGTPRYVSPEQALREPGAVDERTDVYALGVILYELIVGVPPYPVDQARGLKLVEVLTSSNPLRPSALHPDIPRDLELILLKAVSPDKGRRYQSAEALARDMENWLADRPIEARPATLGYRLNRWAWRNRKLLAPLSAAALIVIALSALFGWRVHRQNERSRARESMIAKLTEERRKYVSGYRTAREAVMAAVADRQWIGANFAAKNAPSFWPGESGVGDLKYRVRRAADRFVGKQVSALDELVDEQDYADARRRAEAMAKAALQMPYEPLRARLAEPAQNFRDLCWNRLQKQVEHAYRREDALRQLRRFTEALPDNPHMESARALLAEMESRSADYYMGQHRRAFTAAMDGHRWEEAKRILDSARSLLGKGTVEGTDSWRRRLEEMRHRLDTTIRPGTVERLRVGRRLPSEGGVVTGLAFTPDGALLAAGALHGTVRVWNTGDWQVIFTTERSDDEHISAVDIRADGRMLAAGAQNGTVKLWSISAPEPAAVFSRQQHAVTALQFTPEGNRLMAADLESVMFYDTGQAAPPKEPRVEGRRPAALSPDGSVLAAAVKRNGDLGIALWELPAGISVGNLPPYRNVATAAFAPGGRLLATAHTEKGLRRVRIWRIEDGKELRNWVVRKGVERVLTKNRWVLRFSPDGRMLLTADVDRDFKLWDAKTGRMLAEPPTRSGPRAAAFGPDSRALAVGYSDGSVDIWQVAADRQDNQTETEG